MVRFGVTAQRPLIFLGTARTGNEMRTFHHQLTVAQHPVGALITPSDLAEARITNPMWTQHFWIDAPTVGNVIGVLGCLSAYSEAVGTSRRGV